MVSGGGAVVTREDLWLKTGKVAEYHFVSVLSLLCVVFMEFAESGIVAYPHYESL